MKLWAPIAGGLMVIGVSGIMACLYMWFGVVGLIVGLSVLAILIGMFMFVIAGS